MPNGNRLDVVQTELMATGLYYRVHPTLKPGSDPAEVLSPLAANPDSKARLALRGDSAKGIASRAMFYVATTPAAALLESLLRRPAMLSGHRIRLDAAMLRGNTLSIVRLLKPTPYVPLMKPERGLVVIDPRKEEDWRQILTTPRHEDTHQAAADVARQFSDCACDPPLVLPGFGYPSLQHSQSSVYLLYDPPMRPGIWRVESSTDLASRDGHRAVISAFKDMGIYAISEPYEAIDPDFTPPASSF